MATTYSAGLLNVTTLNATGASAQLTSGTATITNLTATTVNPTNLGITGLQSLNLAGSLTAPNLICNVQLTKDEYHMPTPTGPFAIDIIPMTAKDIRFDLDLFGAFSRTFWDTKSMVTDIAITIFAPSNRTGVDADVTAQLLNCVDPSNTLMSLVDGDTLFHPDDALLAATVLRGDYSLISKLPMDPAFSTLFDSFVAAYVAYSRSTVTGYSTSAPVPTMDSSGAFRAGVIAKFNAMKASPTYATFLRMFSVYSGKIWYNNQTTTDLSGNALTGGYKAFSRVPAPEDNGILSGNGTTFYTSTYTASANLPTHVQLKAAMGDTSGNCPVVILSLGTGVPSYIAQIGLICELTSHGYICIVTKSLCNGAARSSKTNYNQTWLNMATDGFLGNQLVDASGYFDPGMTQAFIGNNKGIMTNNNFMSQGGLYNNSNNTQNLNDPRYHDYTLNIQGETKFGTVDASGVPSYYVDQNGRVYNRRDYVSPFTTMLNFSQMCHTDASNNVFYNNIKSAEKCYYTYRALMGAVGLNSTVVNYGVMGLLAHSLGGEAIPTVQAIKDSSGGLFQATRLVDVSGNRPVLFKYQTCISLSANLYGSTRENAGINLMNCYDPSGNVTYNYSGIVGAAPNFTGRANDPLYIRYDENTNPLPKGFTVPVLLSLQRGPAMFAYTNRRHEYSESIQQILQNTRIYNEDILTRCVQHYTPTLGHVGDANVFISGSNPGAYGLYSEGSAGESITCTNMFRTMFSPDGWTWPERYAIEEYMYGADANVNVEDAMMKHDVQQIETCYLWFKLFLTPNIMEQTSITEVMKYGSLNGSLMQLGSDQIDGYYNTDSHFHYIGPHKMETVRELSNTANPGGVSVPRNHLNLDFGKALLRELPGKADTAPVIQLRAGPQGGYPSIQMVDASGNSAIVTPAMWASLAAYAIANPV